MANLILTTPTPEERIAVWKGSQPEWGSALSVDAYLGRELAQIDSPLARNGGLSHWILTEAGAAPGSRPILSSCETLRKRILVRSADGSVREATAHGVASVFTHPDHRRHGYAGTMISKFAEHLRTANAATPDSALASILFSDIGKKFYAQFGWAPYRSDHLALPANTAAGDAVPSTPIRDADLPALVAADQALVRAELERPSPDQTKTTRVAVIPDEDHLGWWFAREAYVTSHTLGPDHRPDVHGARYVTPSGVPIWVLWARTYSGTSKQPAKNTLYVLRLLIQAEDGGAASVSDEELATALGALLGAAKAEAARSACGKVHVWNPDERVRRVATAQPDLAAEFVVRDTDSISALNWFGEGDIRPETLDWVACEKYSWC